MTTFPPRPVLWRISLAIFLAALVFRLALVVATDQIHLVDWKEMARTGRSIAERGELADPFVVPTGPTAHVPPLYPIFLGLIFKLFGTDVAAEIVKSLLTCVFCALRCALMPLLALRMGLSLRTGVIAGGISVFYINALSTELKGDWAESCGALWLVLMALAALKIVRRKELRVKRAVVLGFWWGLLLLMMSNLLTVLLGFLFACYFDSFRQETRRYLGWSGVLLVVAAVVVSPWPIRNQIRLGSPVWAKDNLGIVMQISNRPGASWSTWGNNAYMQTGIPARNPDEARKLGQVGELAYNQARMTEAIAWIRANPGEFIALSGKRAFYFWFPRGRNLAHTAIEWALTLLALPGLYFLWLKNRVAGLLIASIWLLYPWPYYITQWSSRFRQPIAWSLTLTAAVTLEHVWRRQFPE